MIPPCCCWACIPATGSNEEQHRGRRASFALSGLSTFASILSELEHVVCLRRLSAIEKSEAMIGRFCGPSGEKECVSAICAPMMELSPNGWWSPRPVVPYEQLVPHRPVYKAAAEAGLFALNIGILP